MMLLILPALALVMVFALFGTAVVRPPARPAALLSVYLLSYANIVLVGEITNSFYQLNNPWLWLALHGVLAAAAWLIWRARGKPSLKSAWVGADGRVFPAGWRSMWKSVPDLWLLAFGVGLAFLFSAALIWIMPPNNNDSLATHMSRIAYWMQRGSFFPWSSNRIWQITYPVNMQLQMFWTALFLRSDRLVEIVQWLGALAAMAAVFGLARLLGATRPQSLFAALVWATFPEIILESTTTQNDLVAGTLFAAALYLLFLGLRGHNMGALGLSGLALGLGLGTKQTLLFMLPGLALALLLILLYDGRKELRPMVVWGGCVVGAFLLLSLYMFVVNMISFGHPMGPETAVGAQTGGVTRQSFVQNLTYNSFRLAYQSLDPSGIPDPLWGYSFKLKGLVVDKITRAIHFPVESTVATAPGHQFQLRERYVLQEDAAWYGPLFALLALPALLYQLIRGLKMKDSLRVGIFTLAVSFLLMDAAFRPGWDPYQGRYFIPVVTIATSLIAFIFRPGKGWVALRWAITVLALVIALNTFLYNSGKPVSGQRPIWGMDHLERETLQSFYMLRPARLVEKYVPGNATMGLLAYGMYLEYPFFREDYSRRLVPVYPPAKIQDLAWLKSQGVEYMLVQVTQDSPPVNMPPALVPVANDENWTVFTWAK